jgi:hypothetical protein
LRHLFRLSVPDFVRRHTFSIPAASTIENHASIPSLSGTIANPKLGKAT